MKQPPKQWLPLFVLVCAFHTAQGTGHPLPGHVSTLLSCAQHMRPLIALRGGKKDDGKDLTTIMAVCFAACVTVSSPCYQVPVYDYEYE